MPTQTKHSFLEILHMFPQVKVTAAVILYYLSYTHMGSPHPKFFNSCYCLGLEYCSHYSLITFHPSAQTSPLTGSLTWIPCFPGIDSLTSILCSSLSPHCPIWCSSLTGGQVPFWSTWREQAPDRKGGAFVLEAGNTTWADRDVRPVLRTGQG